MNKSYLHCTLLYLFFLSVAINATAQQRNVYGTVIDEDGQTLPDVTVSLKGTDTAHKTDKQGSFTIAVPTNGGTLIFSSVGYMLKEVSISTESTVAVTLQSELTDLEEVVVIGYGTMRKSDLTGAIMKVDLEQQSE